MEIVDYCRLIEDSNNTNLYYDQLEVMKVGGVVSSLFQLILEVSSELTPDAIDKGLRVPKILSEEGLELWPRDQSGTFVIAFVLGPFEADGATEEGGGKRGTIHPCSA